MTVNVGYYNDPDDYNGLAHFLEHMLFMGTLKYPNINYFMKFINKHGGSTNAYTTTDHTNYHFDIQNEYFSKALDIFGQFFIDPLFDENYVTKEINAVDSEHSKNINNDSARFNRIIALITDKSHPNSKFGTGNMNTLFKPQIREELIKFYNKYYSANIMHLVIYSNINIEESTNLVENIFVNVKNKDVNPIEYTIQQFTFPKTKKIECYKLVKMIPVNNEYILNIIWQLPNLQKKYHSKPLEYISHLLGHESEGSIYYNLDKLGWCTDIFGGSFMHDETTTLFLLNIVLTETGLNCIPTIIDIIYKYIENVLTNGIHKWLYDEQKRIAQINFDLLSKIDPIKYVSDISSNMIYYPPEHILYGPYYYKDFDQTVHDTITKCIAHFKKEQSIVIISSKKYANTVTNLDDLYNIEYSILDNPTNLGEEFKKLAVETSLRLPVKNIFIPSDLSILPQEDKTNLDMNPKLIKSSNNLQVWYKKDNKFNLPRVIMDVIIYNENIYSTVENYLLSLLFIKCFNKKIRPINYYIGLTNTVVHANIQSEHLDIIINSYNDKIFIIIQKILNIFFTFTVTQEEFNTILEDFRIDLENIIYEPPYQIVNEYLKEKTYNKYYNVFQMLESLKNIDYNKSNEMHNIFKNNCCIKCLIQGNIYENESLKLVSLFDSFKINSSSNIDNRRLLNQLKSINEGEEQIFIRKAYNINETDSLTFIYFEIGEIKTNVTKNWDREIVFLMFIHHLLREQFFNQLRSKEQLGYIVNSKIVKLGNIEYPIWGYSFIIQSPKKTPTELRFRIKKFVKNAAKRINKMKDEIFDQYKHSINNKLLTPDNNLFEEYDRNLIEITQGDYMFNRRFHYIDIVMSMTKDTIYNMYQKYFIDRNTRKIRIIEIYCKKHIKKIDK